MDTSHRVIVPGRQMWFQALILFFCAITGVGFFLGWVPNPEALTKVPPWVPPIWYGLVTFGGVVGLAGSYWRWNPYRGLLMERAAMVMLGFGFVLYGVAQMGHEGAAGIVPGLLTLVWVVPCVARGVQTTGDMKTLKAVSEFKDALEEAGAPEPVTLTATGGVSVRVAGEMELHTSDGATELHTTDPVELTTTGDVHLSTEGDIRMRPTGPDDLPAGPGDPS